jgi:hypothetical protein
MKRVGPRAWVACLVVTTACGRVEAPSETGDALEGGVSFEAGPAPAGGAGTTAGNAADAGSQETFVAVSVWEDFACALTASGGALCWGKNDNGQLGNSSAGAYSAVPTPVTGLASGVTAISVGTTSACALTSNGGVQCWGANQSGQLGTDLPSSGAPVPVPGLTAGITAVSVGEDSACALTLGGQVECWGDIAQGPFISGPSGPVPVAGLSSGTTAVSVGSEGSGACALTLDGQVECWGDPTIHGFDAYPPVPVTGLASGVTAVSVGDYSACVVASGGVECWGNAQTPRNDSAWGYTIDPAPVAGLAGPRNAGGTGGNASNLGDAGKTECPDPLTFADPDVELAVRQSIGVPSGPIHAADVAGLTDLDLDLPNSPAYVTPPTFIDYVDPPKLDGLVTSLVGVECIPSLLSLELNPYLVDLTPLGRLPSLAILSFSQTFETNFPPLPHVVYLWAWVYSNTATILSACPSLMSLYLSNTDFSTAEARAALSALTNLTTLSLSGTGLTDTTALAPLSHLVDVELSGNQIQDISSLSALPGLRSLDLSGNPITDLSPLVANLALGYGTAISITNDPALDCAAQQGNIATLRARGVSVDTDCP